MGEEFGVQGYGPASYGDSFADVYDDWYGSLDDADFTSYLSALLPERGATVLELGAGTGRLIEHLQELRPLADDRYVAVDSSDAMLDKLRHRNLPRVTDVCADMCAQLPEGKFDLVFVGYNTIFNVPNEEALRNCLSNVAERLAPRGYFALDAVVPHGDAGETVSVKLATPSHVVLSVSNHDVADQRIIGEFLEFEDDLCVRRRPWVVRYFTPSQIDELAASVGLELVQRHADGTGSPFTEMSPRHVSTYRRPG